MSVSNIRGEKSSRYIVIEGPIGVGKTALSKRLADAMSGSLILEEEAANPFLERFYKDGASAALPTQMFFLFSRARQMEELRQPDLFANVRISDFLFAKDRLFAELNLEPEELLLYEQVAAQLSVEPPVPDLVVYLQAGPDTLLDRIASRGREYERGISRKYLENLADTYARFFHAYNDGPLLIVNASQIDPVSNDSDFELLFEQIQNTTGGRHFFNPVARALA